MHRVEKGLILRAVPYRDADVMLTILTECHGKISASARGVRRKSSRMSAAVQSLAYSEFTLFENGGRFTVNEAESVELFYKLREDLISLSLASYFAEVLDLAADEEIANPELLRLGLNALFALSKKVVEPRIVKAAFELKVAAFSGYEPSISHCAICGDAPDGVFCVEDGTIRCRKCSGAGTLIDAGVLQAMQFILQQDVRRIFSFTLGENALQKLCEITECYLRRHFDRDFRTLAFYKSLV